jgi:hypothetical protein
VAEIERMTDYARKLREKITIVLQAAPEGLTSQQIAIRLGWINRLGDPHITRVASLLSGMHNMHAVDKIGKRGMYSKNVLWKLKSDTNQ